MEGIQNADGAQVDVKVKLNIHDKTQQVKIFTLSQSEVNGNLYTALASRVNSSFPQLADVNHNLVWRDKEGDRITIQNEEDIQLAWKRQTKADAEYVMFEVDVLALGLWDQVKLTGHGSEQHGVLCSSCHCQVAGFRYKCLVCPNFDMCERCETRKLHPAHDMIRISGPKLYPPHFFTRLHRMFERLNHMSPTLAKPSVGSLSSPNEAIAKDIFEEFGDAAINDHDLEIKGTGTLRDDAPRNLPLSSAPFKTKSSNFAPQANSSSPSCEDRDDLDDVDLPTFEELSQGMAELVHRDLDLVIDQQDNADHSATGNNFEQAGGNRKIQEGEDNRKKDVNPTMSNMSSKQNQEINVLEGSNKNKEAALEPGDTSSRGSGGTVDHEKGDVTSTSSTDAVDANSSTMDGSKVDAVDAQLVQSDVLQSEVMMLAQGMSSEAQSEVGSSSQSTSMVGNNLIDIRNLPPDSSVEVMLVVKTRVADNEVFLPTDDDSQGGPSEDTLEDDSHPDTPSETIPSLELVTRESVDEPKPNQSQEDQDTIPSEPADQVEKCQSDDKSEENVIQSNRSSSERYYSKALSPPMDLGYRYGLYNRSSLSRPSYSRTPSRIADALEKMKGMGFTDDDGWLTQLLLMKQGDIGQVLDILTPVKK